MPEPQQADLVLEGGGVKGIALVGSIAELEDAGYTFPHVAGASAGAVVGCLLAAGASASDLERLVPELEYRALLRPENRVSARVPRALYAPGAIARRGWAYSGEYLRTWLAERLGHYGVKTFGDLRYSHDEALRPEQQWKLMVTVTDLTYSRLLRLPQDFEQMGLDPDAQPVLDAVCASAAIPFVFRPVIVASSRRCVDGGFLSNFPIDAFDRTDGIPPRWPTFGVKLLPLQAETAPVQGPDGWRHPGAAGMLRAVLTAMLVGRDQAYLDQPWVRTRTILLDTSAVDILKTNLSPGDQRLLVQEGRSRTAAFLGTWDFEAYRRRFRQPAS